MHRDSVDRYVGGFTVAIRCLAVICSTVGAECWPQELNGSKQVDTRSKRQWTRTPNLHVAGKPEYRLFRGSDSATLAMPFATPQQLVDELVLSLGLIIDLTILLCFQI